MENLKNVISYLQTNDKNGNYENIITEIEEGSLTIENAKMECICILLGWKQNNLAFDDIEGHRKINHLISILANNS